MPYMPTRDTLEHHTSIASSSAKACNVSSNTLATSTLCSSFFSRCASSKHIKLKQAKMESTPMGFTGINKPSAHCRSHHLSLWGSLASTSLQPIAGLIICPGDSKYPCAQGSLIEPIFFERHQSLL